MHRWISFHDLFGVSQSMTSRSKLVSLKSKPWKRYKLTTLMIWRKSMSKSRDRAKMIRSLGKFDTFFDWFWPFLVWLKFSQLWEVCSQMTQIHLTISKETLITLSPRNTEKSFSTLFFCNSSSFSSLESLFGTMWDLCFKIFWRHWKTLWWLILKSSWVLKRLFWCFRL